MKKMILTLFALLTIAASASAMSYEQARNEALFLTDKMAYELNLTDAQYEAAYEINLDYLMGVTSQYDVLGPYWERRNLDLSYILFQWQWDMFRAATYFYRPLVFSAGYWHFSIYARYPHRDYFYFGRPHFFASYRGGHSWRMNGGRSFYEGRRDFYRPAHVHRDQHFGMRNGWDRGDYRGQQGNGHHSSTHVTGGRGQGDGMQQGGYHLDGQRGSEGTGQRRGGFGSSRTGGQQPQGSDFGSGHTDRQQPQGSGFGSGTPSSRPESRSTLTNPTRTERSTQFGGARTGSGSSERRSLQQGTDRSIGTPSRSTVAPTRTVTPSRSATMSGSRVTTPTRSATMGGSRTATPSRSSVSSGRSSGSSHGGGHSSGGSSRGGFGGSRR